MQSRSYETTARCRLPVASRTVAGPETCQKPTFVGPTTIAGDEPHPLNPPLTRLFGERCPSQPYKWS
jgi:hypothetical protein